MQINANALQCDARHCSSGSHNYLKQPCSVTQTALVFLLLHAAKETRLALASLATSLHTL